MRISQTKNRHTGYGGYGTWERGARIIQLNENPSWSMNTWIRFETGDLQLKGIPHQPTPPYQYHCNS